MLVKMETGSSSLGGGIYGYIPSVTNSNNQVTLGFKPKSLIVFFLYSDTPFVSCYDYESNGDNVIRYGNSRFTSYSLPNSTYVGIASIDSNGFTIFNNNSTVTEVYYIAI